MNKEIIQFLAEYYGIDPAEISEESAFVEDLGLQSYSVIEMCSELEERYEIEISEDDIVDMIKISDLGKYIEEKVAEKNNE